MCRPYVKNAEMWGPVNIYVLFVIDVFCYSAYFSISNIDYRILSFSETAMGVSKKTQDKSGFEYAMAVMK